jgi:subtilisin-like proprotein convertase family protein
MKKILAILFILSSQNIFSQAVPIVNMQTGSISTCRAIFYDSGGANHSYLGGETYTFTFCPLFLGASLSDHISISFSNLSLAAGDILSFYDASTASPDSLITTFTSTTNIQDVHQLINASPYNRRGCITVVFRSLSGNIGNGWEANVNCSPFCQSFKAVIDSISTTAIGGDSTHINSCYGQPFYIRAHGIYEQNDIGYHQSDSTSRFLWNFGDGRGIIEGQTISFPQGYLIGGGAYLQMQMNDSRGCSNYNTVKRALLVSPRPLIRLGTLPQQICYGDSLRLAASSSTGVYTFLRSLDNPFNSRLGDTSCILDGQGELISPHFYTNFIPNSRLTSLNDLSSIQINIEHTWVRDLEIALICPSGQRAILHNFTSPSGNGWVLGNPVNGGTCLNQEGLTYTWTPTATTTLREYISTTPLPANRKVPNANPFAAYNNSLVNLLGCPLNGRWALSIRDLWSGDFGVLLGWGLNLSGSQNTNVETGTSEPFISHNWLPSNDISTYTQDTIVVRPRTTGISSFDYRIVDRFGCQFDTIVNIPVLSAIQPIISGFSNVCIGSTTQLDAGQGYSNYLWSNGSTSQIITTTQSQASTSQTYSVTVTNTSGCTATASKIVVVGTNTNISIQGATYLCQGSNLTLDAGAGFLSYSWNNGSNNRTITVTTPQVYAVTVTLAGGCIGTGSKTVLLSSSNMATLTGMPPTIRVNSPLVRLTGTPSGGVYSGRGMVGQIFNPSLAGLGSDTLRYTYVDSITGCTSIATTIIQVDNASTGIEQLKDELYGLTIYPNPAGDMVNIVFDGSDLSTTIRITDIYGRLVLSFYGKELKRSSPAPLSIVELPIGTYFVRVIENQTGKLGIAKLVKR